MRLSSNIHPDLGSAILVLLSASLHLAADQRCGDDDDDANGQPCFGANGLGRTGNLQRSHMIPPTTQSETASSSCLRVAVVEYSRKDTYGDCREDARTNLDVLEKVLRIAYENGVKMLVLPEDGIYINTAKATGPCLEEIPDPDTLKDGDNNPCAATTTSKNFRDTPILSRLSCLAKRYKLYLVANYGTRQQCDNQEPAYANTTNCSKDRDYLMLNTDVVLDPEGRFIKRYRKWHPYTLSEIFDKAPKLEHAYFDTPYGRFGVFTCFDIIYKDPAVQLVEDYQIDTAIFPTWWFDEAPILTAIHIQDGWSEANKVNMLAANILKPLKGSTGSSIFSRNNSLHVAQKNFNQDKQTVSRTRLLIANIEGRPRTPKESTWCDENFDPKVIDIDDNETNDGYKHANYKLLESDTYETLSELEATKTLCSGEFCCTLDYKLLDDTSPKQIRRLILIVRNSRRPGRFQWHEQVCALSILDESTVDRDRLVEKVIYDQNGAYFQRLSLRGKFDSKHVYPVTAQDGLQLIDRRRRQFACNELEVSEKEFQYHCRLDYVPPKSDSEVIASERAAKIYSFAMYGRLYVRDPISVL